MNSSPLTQVVLRNARLADGTVIDVVVNDGLVASVGARVESAPSAAESIIHELDGALLLPAPADPHAHLDKALTVERVPNTEGDLLGAIRAFSAYAADASHLDIVDRATEAALIQLANGTTAIRTHVNIAQGIGIRAVEALIEVRETLRDLVDIQIVALTGGGTPLTGREGMENRAILRDAMDAGADVVGGCPHLDPDPTACLEVCLDLAAELGKPIDLHTDEELTEDMLGLEQLADLVIASDFPHAVAASHCVSLGMQDEDDALRIAEKVSAAGIAVITLPQTNLYLQARAHPTRKPRGLTAAEHLLRVGTTLAAGGDNLRDPFNPLGRGDQLETASLLVAAGHLTIEQALAAVTTSARTAMRLPDAGIALGMRADLLAIGATTTAEAIAAAPSNRWVFRQGQLVSHTESTTRYPAATWG